MMMSFIHNFFLWYYDYHLVNKRHNSEPSKWSLRETTNITTRGSSVVWWLFDNTTPHWPKSHHTAPHCTTLRWIAKLGIFRQKVAHFGDFWHKSGDFRFYCISRKIRAFGANWHFSVVFSVVWCGDFLTTLVWCGFKKSPHYWIL